MKKKFVRRIIALILSTTLIFVSCVFSTTAIETDIDNLFTNMEYDNEFYITQTESVRIYNEMLEAFAEENSTVYSLMSETTEETYPEYYGGAYIDENGELVVLVTEMTNSVNAEVQQVTNDSSQVSTELCEVSYNEMCYVIDFLTDRMEMLRNQGVVIDSICDNIMDGKVIVSIIDLNQSKEEVVREYIDCEFLEFVNSDGMESTANSVGGGYGIASDNGTSTAGFAAVYQSGETVGLVAAGHAFQNFGDKAYYNGEYIGFVWETAYYDGSTADAAFITPDSDVEITGILKNGGHVFGGFTTVYPVNSTIYMYGNVSKLQSGKITSTSSSVYYNELDITFKKQCVATYSSQKGDSGAPILFFDGNYGGKSYYVICGVQSGYNKTKGVSFYSPYGNIVNELGITCVTS